MRKKLSITMSALMLASLVACNPQVQNDDKSNQADSTTPDISTDISAQTDAPLTNAVKPATQFTKEANDKVYTLLDFDDKTEEEFANRGFMVAPDSLVIKTENDIVVWNQDAYDFARNAKVAPDSANPSLWRNTAYNALYGLFKVTEDIYQVRGYDIANITFVRSDNGWIILDCGSSRYTSSKALELFRSQMGDDRIVAVIVSHAHVDHYGGIEGLISASDAGDSSLSINEQIAAGKTAVIVPEGFEDAVMKENVFAGSAMKRRASYQYGLALPYSATGRLSVGIGLTAVHNGSGYIKPSFIVKEDVFETDIDGVKAIFQLTPGTESPAEMNTYFPDMKALWMAENCTGTMHNLYTLRGAEVRDANSWARYITEAQTLFSDAEVVFQSHNWPHWGNDVIHEYMTNTASVYKFIHDQTLLYINQGYTSTEIASMIQLPEALEKVWYTRQYYGTLKHNVKAVYQKYMGWYDANPIHLNQLEPTEYAKKLVEYLGDTDAVMAMARADFEKGEYQWVAEITNALVFADPTNTDARHLCADALEQLGYQSESGAWRNAYLVAAIELRYGTGIYPRTNAAGLESAATGMDSQTLLDYMGKMIDTEKLADKAFSINLNLGDGENYLLKINHGVLLYYKSDGSADADFTMTTSPMGLLAIIGKKTDAISSAVKVENDSEGLFSLLCDSIATVDSFFNIIEP